MMSPGAKFARSEVVSWGASVETGTLGLASFVSVLSSTFGGATFRLDRLFGEGGDSTVIIPVNSSSGLASPRGTGVETEESNKPNTAARKSDKAAGWLILLTTFCKTSKAVLASFW